MRNIALVQASESYQAQERQSQFSVCVNLVSLDIEVLDPQGESVPDLKRSEFAIREDGKPREISSFAWVTGQPVSLTMILDTSALTNKRLSAAKQYITLLAHLLAREDEVCLYTFDYRDAWLEQHRPYAPQLHDPTSEVDPTRSSAACQFRLVCRWARPYAARRR